jgi:hypothetical protein
MERMTSIINGKGHPRKTATETTLRTCDVFATSRITMVHPNSDWLPRKE